MFAIVWRFTVAPEHVREFLEAYGPGGAWEQLFQQAEGYLGTELLQSADADLAYLTVDRWTSEQAFLHFQRTYEAQYRELDQLCEALTTAEVRIGGFATLR